MSNDSVKRRLDEMAENLEERLAEKLKVSKFSLQIDETTVNNSVLLLVYVRYIDALVIHEEMLFINKLIKRIFPPYNDNSLCYSSATFWC